MNPNHKAGERVFLGIDYGLKRVGVAIGQELTRTASDIETLHINKRADLWPMIERLINEWRPDAAIVGIPYNMDGSEHEMTRAARNFCHELEARFNLPVHEMDERLSSIEAEELLRESSNSHTGRGRKSGRISAKNKDEIDRVAARLILQSWLNQLP